MKAFKGDWVEIENIVLTERVENIPEDTKEIPLKSYIQGFLKNESASIGNEVSILTLTDRVHIGKLSDISPSFDHHFGKLVPELLSVGHELKQMLQETGEK